MRLLKSQKTLKKYIVLKLFAFLYIVFWHTKYSFFSFFLKFQSVKCILPLQLVHIMLNLGFLNPGFCLSEFKQMLGYTVLASGFLIMTIRKVTPKNLAPGEYLEKLSCLL